MEKDLREHLKTKARLFAVDLTANQQEAIFHYLDMLASYNQHTNLVSCADKEVVIDHHIVDSLALSPVMEKYLNLTGRAFSSEGTACNRSYIDIGSGAGFPGFILAIVQERLKVVLVESIDKKARFLRLAASELSLASRVEVMCQRAEQLSHDRNLRHCFDLATARAVSTIDVVCELSLPFLKVGGVLLAQKSTAQLLEEVSLAERALNILSGEIVETISFDARFLGKEHACLVIRKTGKTSSAFAREAHQIKKNPLGRKTS